MSLSIDERITAIEQFTGSYNNIFDCFEIQNDKLIHNGTETKFSVKHLAEGGKHVVLEICESDNDKCIGNKYVLRKSLLTESDSEYDMTLDVISNRYALMFSDIVKSNVCPNFPLIANTYLCDKKINYSISIQEHATGRDLNAMIKNPDISIESMKKNILQTLLTIYFINHNLNLAINDAKPGNVLLQPIQPRKITYKIGTTYITMDVDSLALVTDFDDVTANNFPDVGSEIKTELYKHFDSIFQYYVTGAVKDIYNDPRMQNEKISVDSENISITDINDFDKDNSYTLLYKIAYLTALKSESYFYRDIFNFLILVCNKSLIDPRTSDISALCYRFMRNSCLKKLDFFDNIKECFGDVCEISDKYDISSKLYSLDADVFINTNDTRYSLYNQHLSTFVLTFFYPDKFYRNYVINKREQLFEKLKGGDEDVKSYMSENFSENTSSMLKHMLGRYIDIVTLKLFKYTLDNVSKSGEDFSSNFDDGETPDTKYPSIPLSVQRTILILVNGIVSYNENRIPARYFGYIDILNRYMKYALL